MPGLNEIIEACKGCGGRGYGYSRLKKQWTESVCWFAKAAQVSKVVTYRLDITWLSPSTATRCRWTATIEKRP